MAIQPTLGKLSRLEFLAVLTPGFYILCIFLFIIFAVTTEKPISIINQLKEFPNVFWVPLTLLLLLTSYVFGSIPRAFSVTMTDNFCCKIFYTKKRVKKLLSGYKKELRRELFPYPRALRHQLKALAKAKILKNRTKNPNRRKIRLPDDNDPNGIALFDYWKDVLLMRAPDTSPLIESLEARSRFFVGMFWASFLGTISGIILMAVCLLRNGFKDYWFILVACFVLISILFFMLFGVRLRSVRGEEARHVFFSYLEYTLGN